MPMSFEMDEMRKSLDSVAIYSIYLRLGIGGYLFVLNESTNKGYTDMGLKIGSPMSYNYGNGLPSLFTDTYVERADSLMDISDRIVTFPTVLLADGIQENNGVSRFYTKKKSTVSFKLNNFDNYFTVLWGKEPLIGAEVFCKMGFVGLDYIYFYEVLRGKIIRVRFIKSNLEVTLEY